MDRFKVLFWIGILFFFSIVCSFAQHRSPYSINWKTEPYYVATGAAMYGSGIYLSSKMSVLKEEDIAQMLRSAVPEFDRVATFNHSEEARKASNYFYTTSSLLPVLFLAGAHSRKYFPEIALLWGETAFLTIGITNLTKRSVLRARPLVYNSNFDLGVKQTKNARLSFFSGHTSVTAANCFFAAKIFNDFYPDSPLKPYVWGLAASIPAFTGYFRVKAGAHFPSDVIIGYGVGAFIGYMVPQLHRHRKDRNRNSNFTLNAAGNGMVLNWTF